MQLVLRAAGILGIIVSVIWWFAEPGYDPLYAFLTGFVAFLSSYIVSKAEKQGESLDQRNRRVLLNHVENFWIKGVLEKSLHGAALLELGIKEDPSSIDYPWTIKRESTGDILPTGKSMLDIFHEVGLGRSLLILGAPGSGKTTMLLELARQLIKCARQDVTEPIPVVFNLASWTEKQTLAEWLADQLNAVYYVPKKIGPSWVKGDSMLLLLDGLDEVKQSSQAKCVRAINQFRNEHGLTSLVICSRTQDYSAIGDKLALEGAISLQPLASKQIGLYLDRFGETRVAIWRLLRKDKALQELAKTPLLLSLITLAYTDQETNERLASGYAQKRREYLFDVYIERMFERPTRAAKLLFTKGETLRYLHWLARKMMQNNTIPYQVEAMQPSWLERDGLVSSYRVSLGLIFGLVLRHPPVRQGSATRIYEQTFPCIQLAPFLPLLCQRRQGECGSFPSSCLRHLHEAHTAHLLVNQYLIM